MKGRKIIPPHPSEFLADTPVIKGRLTRKKTHRHLLTCVPHGYMAVAQGEELKEVALESRLKHHLHGEKEGGPCEDEITQCT